MRIVLALTLLAAALNLGGVEAPLKCAACGQAIRGKFFWMEGVSAGQKRALCKACGELDEACFVCALPVNANSKRLEDGRVLCADDAAIAVLSQASAERTFAEARRELFRLLAGFGTLPDRNIKIRLVSKREIDLMHGGQLPGHAKTIVMGLTHSKEITKGEFEHTIYIMDGLPPARFLAVAAHEWAHTWIHENVSRERKLDSSSTEGFCEWVAYKLMNERNESLEKKMILANTYTRGQIDAFLKAEEDLRPHMIVKWMKEGADGRIDSENAARVRTTKEAPVEAPVWRTAARTAVPDHLMLKGISGTANRRFALINDCTLRKDEVGKVRVGSSNVVLQCVQIGANSVVVRLRGTEQTTELFLGDVR